MTRCGSRSRARESNVKIALGPNHYYWSRIATLQFYEAMCAAPVDIVYLGETVCARRHELRAADWFEIAHMLSQAGKEVVLSTQVLLESGKDVATMQAVTGNARYLVEANDMGAVHCVQGNAFVAGPWLNLYNEPALNVMIGLGAKRWVMPLEMGADALAQMQAARPEGIETEVFAYGRLPLAFSARCFTARCARLCISCRQEPPRQRSRRLTRRPPLRLRARPIGIGAWKNGQRSTRVAARVFMLGVFERGADGQLRGRAAR